MKVVALAAAIAALGAGSASALNGAPLTVDRSVSSQSLYFADTITARVTIIVDRRQIDPASIHVGTAFGDWNQVAPTRTTSLSAGPFERRSWSFAIACLQASCLPRDHPLEVHLGPVTVSARRVNGSTVTVQRGWPTISIAPRFGPAAPGLTPRFNLDQELRAATYRVEPTAFAFWLDVGALLLGGFGLWIVARELLKRRTPRAFAVPPLVRALAFVRQAKARPIDDRRRAAGLLARALAADPTSSLSATASHVAWSVGEPAPDRLEELARMVEAEHRERA